VAEVATTLVPTQSCGCGHCDASLLELERTIRGAKPALSTPPTKPATGANACEVGGRLEACSPGPGASSGSHVDLLWGIVPSTSCAGAACLAWFPFRGAGLACAAERLAEGGFAFFFPVAFALMGVVELGWGEACGLSCTLVIAELPSRELGSDPAEDCEPCLRDRTGLFLEAAVEATTTFLETGLGLLSALADVRGGGCITAPVALALGVSGLGFLDGASLGGGMSAVAFCARSCRLGNGGREGGGISVDLVVSVLPRDS